MYSKYLSTLSQKYDELKQAGVPELKNEIAMARTALANVAEEMGKAEPGSKEQLALGDRAVEHARKICSMARDVIEIEKAIGTMILIEDIRPMIAALVQLITKEVPEESRRLRIIEGLERVKWPGMTQMGEVTGRPGNNGR